MVFPITAFYFFKMTAVSHFRTSILKRESKSKARRYNHNIVFRGISYPPIFIYNSTATVGHIIIAIVIFIWFISCF